MAHGVSTKTIDVMVLNEAKFSRMNAYRGGWGQILEAKAKILALGPLAFMRKLYLNET